MTARVQRLKLRLFVEGVEMPCIAATIQSQPNSPMTASIQIPPLVEATRFLPRSLVHLYFLDFYEEENPGVRRSGSSLATAPGPTVAQQDKDRAKAGEITNEQVLDDARAQKYKLLFVGDLMGFQWTKNAVNRSVVLQCADPSNYWDYALQFNNTDLFGPGIKATFSGGSTNKFTDILSTPGEQVTRVLMTPSQRYPKLQGLLGGIIHLLETMGGYYVGEKKVAGQNVFFTLAELRLHITQMITAYDRDQTSRKLMGGKGGGLFGRSIGNLGDQASFRKIVNMLASYIFHETYGQPCPRYVPGTGGTVSGISRKRLKDIKTGTGVPFASLAASADGLADFLNDALTNLELAGANVPPADDVKGRALYEKQRRGDFVSLLSLSQKQCNTLAAKANSLARGTYAAAGHRVSALFKAAGMACGKSITAAKREFTPGGIRVPVTVEENTVRAVVVPVERNSSNRGDVQASSADDYTTTYVKEKKKTVRYVTLPPTKSNQGIGTSVKEAVEALRKIPDIEAAVSGSNGAIPAQLKQQILRPDVWFSAPPRCNVIFPDQYSTLSYSRQFMQEPTRLMLKTNDEFFGEDMLFDHFYFAPKAITLKSEKNTLQAVLKGDLMDHELFTGILPVFEKMGEFAIFAARSGMVNGKTPKIGLAQRSTNFLYFKYRFAARQLQVTGKFNPYLAVGFPGLVVDKYVDLATLKLHTDLLKSQPNPSGMPSPAALDLMGTHFLANFTELTHQIDQSQGTTAINCSYARQVEEKSEFLGSVQSEVSVKKKTGNVAKVKTVVASVFPPKVNSQGPNFGRIVSVTDVTQAHHGGDFETSEALPVFASNRDKKTKQLSLKAPVGFARHASFYGDKIVEMVGDPLLIVTFRAYEVWEEKSQTKIEKVDLPPEEYIRPGWYGDCWHPSNISEVYYDFFDIGAITEPQQVHNYNTEKPEGAFTASDAGKILDSAETDPVKFAQDQLLALSLVKGATIQQAVAHIVLTYSIVRQAGFDTNEFIRGYTWRPIASMVDMFGSSDLQLDPTGNSVVNGVEGFHSRAFGPFDDLFGLVTPEIESVVGIKRGTAPAEHADTRKRKYQAALDYIAQLRLSRAMLG